jgi:hypothetical protein
LWIWGIHLGVWYVCRLKILSLIFCTVNQNQLINDSVSIKTNSGIVIVSNSCSKMQYGKGFLFWDFFGGGGGVLYLVDKQLLSGMVHTFLRVFTFTLRLIGSSTSTFWRSRIFLPQVWDILFFHVERCRTRLNDVYILTRVEGGAL